MSSVSTNGSPTSPAGSASSPASSGSRKWASLKFWLNQLERTTVQAAPDRMSASSLRCASSSPRPDSSTSRSTPASIATPASAPTASGAPGAARSGKYDTDAADAPSSAGAEVGGAFQSNGGRAEREPRRTGTSSARRRSTTRRPVLPDAPSTTIGGIGVPFGSGVRGSGTATGAGERDERGEQQALQPDGEERRVRLLVVRASEYRQVEQVPRQHARGHAASLGSRADVREHLLHLQRGPDLDAHPGLVVAVIGEAVHDARRDLDDLAGPRDDGAQADAEAHPAGEDREALGLDRVHVRHGHGAAGPQGELEAQQLAGGGGRGLDEREALTGHRVLECLSGSDHAVQCPPRRLDCL